ncbi:MAG TPA: hypothetical protein VFU00_02905 [Gemmatimonadales bacterium]|nr:hypothetical protein [Gemmatimonadales bacterium]
MTGRAFERPPSAAIDRFMPEYGVRSLHAIRIAAPPARVLAAVRDADLGSPWLVRLLMGIRTLPVLLGAGPDAWRRRRSPDTTIRGFMGGRFTVLAEEPDEILLGLQGRFWTPTGSLVAIDPATFTDGPPEGVAQAAWNFRVVAEGDGTRLSTETRVRFRDGGTARRFGRYWRAVGPFSGLMRRRMLALIRREAERGSFPSS